MQVVTLNPEALEAHAARLAREVERADTSGYDAIVAVRRGGAIVCDAFCRHYPASKYGARFDVELQRPSTRKKGKVLGKILRLLPYPVLDAMRMAESLLLSFMNKSKKAETTLKVEMPEGLTRILTNAAKPNVLLIDDAIDSGDTLYAIVETLKKKNPDTTADIAVLTETTGHPRIRAKHTLYRNRTLIRFPWSDDYKTP